MDTNKNYSLFIEHIDDAVASFVNREGGISLEIERPDDSKVIYRISKDKNTGVINVYKKKNGLFSITIQGAPSLSNLCTRCCDSFIQQTSIPNSLRKNFTIRNSKKDNWELFKLELTETYKLQILDKNTDGYANIEDSFDVQTNSGVKVSCTLYSNDTFMMQGNVTSLFLILVTESLRWLADERKLNYIPETLSLQNITQTFSEDINELVPNLDACGDDDGIIKRMILTSVALFNSGVIVEDYGCYTFGVLKALEGVLKLRLSEDIPPVETLGDFYYYDTTSHRHRLRTTVYDGQLELKKALNKGYNNWVSSRHSSFHADEQISTSTLLSYEQAHEVFEKTLDCINSICDNWN